MSAPTAYEQLILELINRARLDPNREASRLGISLNEDLSPGQISGDSKQPLAYSSVLNNAAAGHSNWMLANNVFSHTGAGGSDPGDRMATAGYQFSGNWTWGENIAWNGTTGTLNVLQAARSAHDGLFESSGHRHNILNDNFKEIGVGAEVGSYRGYNAFMLTENFAKSGSGNFVTGVAYSDNNGDSFYSINEGRGSVNVSLREGGTGLGSTSTWDAGGYSLKTTETGNITVTFSGGGLPAAVAATIVLANENAKVDLIGANRIESSVTTTLGQNAKSLLLLGLDDLDGTGASRNEHLSGNGGKNVLTGGSGNDLLNGGAGDDTLKGGPGNDRLMGGPGNDSFSGGSGVDLVDFSASAVGVNVDLTLGTASGEGTDALSGINQVTGSAFGDVLRGDSSDNRFDGKGGEDFVDARGGHDTLIGGTRADELFGGSGNDYLIAQSGNDRANGGSGNDTIEGGRDDDFLVGGPGNDKLVGDAGNDEMTGGSGNDTFVFEVGSGSDTIAGFQPGANSVDVIDFSALEISYNQLTIVEQGGNALIITPDNSSVLLMDVASSSLDPNDDFLF